MHPQMNPLRRHPVSIAIAIAVAALAAVAAVFTRSSARRRPRRHLERDARSLQMPTSCNESPPARDVGMEPRAAEADDGA
jgi:hypothetical protein